MSTKKPLTSRIGRLFLLGIFQARLKLIVLLLLCLIPKPFILLAQMLPSSSLSRVWGDDLLSGDADIAAVVEGCFNHFDAIVLISPDPHIIGIHNNIRCRTACGAQGYALAATRSNPSACLCGNEYPSPFHQVRYLFKRIMTLCSSFYLSFC